MSMDNEKKASEKERNDFENSFKRYVKESSVHNLEVDLGITRMNVHKLKQGLNVAIPFQNLLSWVELNKTL